MSNSYICQKCGNKYEYEGEMWDSDFCWSSEEYDKLCFDCFLDELEIYIRKEKEKIILTINEECKIIEEKVPMLCSYKCQKCGKEYVYEEKYNDSFRWSYNGYDELCYDCFLDEIEPDLEMAEDEEVEGIIILNLDELEDEDINSIGDYLHDWFVDTQMEEENDQGED